MKVLSCLIAMLGLIGCSSGSAPATADATNAAPPPVEVMLEDIAKSGELGSGSEGLRQELEKMKATNEAKAKALLADLDHLQKMTEPSAIKTEAQKMLQKL